MAARKTIRAPGRTAKRGTAQLQSRRPKRHDLLIPIVQSDDRFERIPGFAGTHSCGKVAGNPEVHLRRGNQFDVVLRPAMLAARLTRWLRVIMDVAEWLRRLDMGRR